MFMRLLCLIAAILAQLSTLHPPPAYAQETNCVQCPSGLIAWWPGDGSGNNLAGTGNGTLQSGATFAAGQVGQAFSLDGVDDHVAVADDPRWAFGTNAFTIQLWANFNASTGRRTFVASDAGGGTQNKWILWLDNGKIVFHLNGSSGYADIGAVPFSPDLGRWYHLAVARNLSTYNFYLDGQVIGTASDSRSVPDANAPLTFGQAEGSFRFHGLLDEVAIFNRALSAEEIAAIYAAGTNGMCKDALPPTLLTWPTNQYVALGSSITLTVTASGTEPLSYQWRFHGTNLPGAANSAFSLQPSALSDSGPYSVIVTNAYGAATSPEAVLTVVPPPLITAQPQSQARPLGYPVTLSVRADSLTPLNYQWLKDGTNMPSATNSNYTIATIQSNHIGTYACLVSNLAGAVLSSDATLSLRDPIFNNPEVFETGLGDWRVDGSGWQVRSGGVGGGTNCMAVVASGNYPRGLDTRLISPEFDVPAALENPELLT